MNAPSKTSDSALPGADAAFWRAAVARRDASSWTPWSDEERDALLEVNRLPGAGPALERNVAALGDAETLVVCAGQQAGLFLSPLYILHKAAAAVRWAERLEDLLGRRVAPVFWVASEDHDFEEVRRVRYLDAKGRLREWVYGEGDSAFDEAAGRSVFDAPWRPDLIEAFLNEIEERTHDTEFRAEILASEREALAASGNLEDFFMRGMARLFGGRGLVLLPSRLAPLRRRAAAVLRREIENPGESTRQVMQAAQAADDKRPALHRRGDEANFFVYRDRLRCKTTVEEDGRFALRHPVEGDLLERLDASALLDLLENDPAAFSPNVVTRPVVQDAALPTVAMIGGAGERAYLAQLEGVYRHFGVPRSAVLARPSVLLVEPPVARRLEKHDIATEMLREEPWERIEDRFVLSGDRAEAAASVELARETALDAVEGLRGRLGAFSQLQPINSALDKTGGAVAKAFENLAGRVRKELEQESERAGGRLSHVRDALRPAGLPQERALAPLAPFLVNHGTRFADWLTDAIDLDDPKVQPLYPGTLDAEG